MEDTDWTTRPASGSYRSHAPAVTEHAEDQFVLKHVLVLTDELTRSAVGATRPIVVHWIESPAVRLASPCSGVAARWPVLRIREITAW